MPIDSSKFLTKTESNPAALLLKKKKKRKNRKASKFREDTYKKQCIQHSIREPLGNDKGTIEEPHKGTIRERLGNDKGTKVLKQKNKKYPLGYPLGNREKGIREPLGNHKGTKSNIYSLSGNEKKILKHLFLNCYQQGLRVARVILYEITKTLQISSKSVCATTLKRLVKKEIILRKGGKRGNGGFADYEIPESIYQHLILDNLELGNDKGTIREPLGNHKGTDKGTDKGTSPPSSSSNNNNINTITTRPQMSDQKDRLISEWDIIQTPEILKELGFGKKHISDMKRNFKFSASDIQELLDLYAYDLEQGELDKLKSRNINPVRYFFGCLKKGGYNSVHGGFKSPEEQAQEDQMALLEKRKKEKEKNRKNLEALAFNEWIEKTPDEEIKKLVSPGRLAFMGFVHKPMVQGYFIKNEMEKFLEELH